MSLTLTHYWDCNGFGCDSTTLQPWNESAYFASAAYAPIDPTEHGGPSAHGESLWLFGAASDDLAAALGATKPTVHAHAERPWVEMPPPPHSVRERQHCLSACPACAESRTVVASLFVAATR